MGMFQWGMDKSFYPIESFTGWLWKSWVYNLMNKQVGRKTFLQLGLPQEGFLSRYSLVGRHYDAVFPLNYLLQPLSLLPDFFNPLLASIEMLPGLFLFLLLCLGSLKTLLAIAQGHTYALTQWCQIISPTSFAGCFHLVTVCAVAF